MTEDKEKEKLSPLGQTLEDEGYTGVAKYLKAFSLGYNGEAESFIKGVKDRKNEEANKLKEIEKENNEFRKKIAEGNTQTQEKLDNLNQEKIRLIKAGKVDEANAVANKMNNIVNKTAEYVNSINQNYGMGVNGKPLADITIDVSAYDTRQYTIKKIDGKEFAIPKDDEGNNFAYNSQSNRVEAIVSDGTTTIDENGRIVQPKGVGVPYTSAFEISSEESSIGTGSVEIIGADGEKDLMSKSDYYKLEENKRPKLWIKPESENQTDYDKKFNTRLNYLKTLPENSNKPEAELRNQASEDIRNTANERAEKSLNNQRKMITKKYNVESVYDLPLEDIKKTGKGREEIDNLYIKSVKNIHGDSASKIIGEASKAIYGAESLYKSGAVFARGYEKQGNNINFIDKWWDRNIGSYIGKTVTDDTKIEAGKYIARMMNTQRNQDFGAVVPQAEMNNFTDAATSLLKTDKEILLGVNAMLERQLEDIKIAKDKLGDEAFYLKYGNADKAVIQKIEAIKEVIGTKKKDEEDEDKTNGINTSVSGFNAWKKSRGNN